MPPDRKLNSLLTTGSAEANDGNGGTMLSRYLAENPHFTERLVFDLPKQPIAVQQTNQMPVNPDKVLTVEHRSGTERHSDDLMEELSAIVRDTSHQEK